ncbi:hypothetical protein A3A39_04915 [Candidatus Kaiserbacteria bacterium RIFCSPLOWO2_01_FULL_54_13]|uniref:Nucleotidyl transferase domain-containing protein n=1 Tax=Candidatus Kaiserbacteria bacterium RIFCSPLOWO2_01_FULL_54_13 TaxID=1798512 RepID=A0A1F6F077_9BACT|nr:MAG: hypothetical protein A3A39_04915 [Candidatus Kaiserbacteria bacterium RIFCSPLOWO2_01_FULL_54_13]
MQCVILAAGRGSRMVELTTALPKPMLDVAGRPLLEYKLDALPDEVNEVVIIVGYLGDIIRRHFGERYGGKHVTYIEQETLNGTAGALWYAAPHLHDRFLVIMGDDIYAKEDVARLTEASEGWKLLVQQLPAMHRAGSVQLDASGLVAEIVESDREDEARLEPGIASTNLYMLDTRLFSCSMVPKHAGSLEFGLPQTVVAAARQLGIPFEPVFTDKWIQITAPNDLVTAAERLKKASL